LGDDHAHANAQRYETANYIQNLFSAHSCFRRDVRQFLAGRGGLYLCGSTSTWFNPVTCGHECPRYRRFSHCAGHCITTLQS
jgi:hypothetical protein